MIALNNLGKNYSGNWALQGATWAVEKNRTVGLLGPNGAGKSTSMKMMTGLLAPTEGEVLVDGDSVVHKPQETKSKIGYLPETPPLYEELTVGSYLRFVAGLKGLGKNQVPSAVGSALERLQLEGVELKPIAQLSKGFRQRVGIAQALVANSPILILDEPSVGLDPQQVFELRNVIRGLKEDHTIILSTHVLSEVEQICDDVVILNQGKIKASGPLQEILKKRKGHHGIRIGVTNPSPEAVKKLKTLNTVEVADYVPNLGSIEIFSQEPLKSLDECLQILLSEKAGVVDIERYQPDLEDAYMHLTTDGNLTP